MLLTLAIGLTVKASYCVLSYSKVMLIPQIWSWVYFIQIHNSVCSEGLLPQVHGYNFPHQPSVVTIASIINQLALIGSIGYLQNGHCCFDWLTLGNIEPLRFIYFLTTAATDGGD